MRPAVAVFLASWEIWVSMAAFGLAVGMLVSLRWRTDFFWSAVGGCGVGFVVGIVAGAVLLAAERARH
jgi:hypothetical protein